LIALALSLALLGALPQDERAAQAAVDAALARDPRSLPSAPPGHWSEWTPKAAVPDELSAPLAAAMRAYFAGDYGEALRGLLAILEAEPDFPPALYQAGTTYFRLRRYGDTAQLYERFLRAAPQEVGATQALGHAYYSLGEYPRAREHYEKVLAAAPESVEALRGYALTRMRLGEPETALELLGRVLELREAHADAHTWKAQILFDLGRAEEALASARRARELDPFEPRSAFLESQALAELGQDAEAAKAAARFEELSRAEGELRSLEALLVRAPRDFAVLARMVEIQRGIGNLAEVRGLLERMTRTQPQDVALRVYALDVLEAAGDVEGAAAAALALERIGAEDAAAWKRLERYYAGKDRVRQVQAGERYRRLGGRDG
jgi:predicted Zn-dependent protease